MPIVNWQNDLREKRSNGLYQSILIIIICTKLIHEMLNICTCMMNVEPKFISHLASTGPFSIFHFESVSFFSSISRKQTFLIVSNSLIFILLSSLCTEWTTYGHDISGNECVPCVLLPLIVNAGLFANI